MTYADGVMSGVLMWAVVAGMIFAATTSVIKDLKEKNASDPLTIDAATADAEIVTETEAEVEEDEVWYPRHAERVRKAQDEISEISHRVQDAIVTEAMRHGMSKRLDGEETG